MSKIDFVKAEEFIDVRDGTHDSPKFVENGYPLVTSKNLINGKIDFTSCNEISLEDHELISRRSRVDNGDILYAMIGTIGNPVIVEKDREFSIKNVALFKFNNDKVYNRYFYHYLKSKDCKRQLEKLSRGGTQKFVSLGNLRKMIIPLPPLSEQKRIADILDKADELRQKRQQSIEKLDELLQATFIDMFGDPKDNPNKYQIRKLSEFYINEKDGTKCGPFGSALKKEEYKTNGIPVWSMDVITLKGEFTDKPTLWIDADKFIDLKSYSVNNGDVIISRAGTVGKMGVVRSKYDESIISTNLIRVRFGNELLPEYFISLMTYCKNRLSRLKTGADGSFTHMNTGILDNLEFPYPPISQQKKYVDFSSRLNHHKVIIIKQLEQQENLFQSLQQRAFNGEL